MLNKIIITDDNISFDEKDNNIKFQLDNESIIKTLFLDILNDTKLEIEYNIKEEIKIEIVIKIMDNVSIDILDKKDGYNMKCKYQYMLGLNSKVVINKINDCKMLREYDVCDLNGENSSFSYVLKTISKDKEIYNIEINHNKRNTYSDIYMGGINIDDGSVIFNITGKVLKGCTDSIVNQVNRIINFTDNECQINPNLLIDEMGASANHSAHISNFDDDDLFYLQLRGIERNEAIKLLVKSVLMADTFDVSKEYIKRMIDKYWR